MEKSGVKSLFIIGFVFILLISLSYNVSAVDFGCCIHKDAYEENLCSVVPPELCCGHLDDADYEECVEDYWKEDEPCYDDTGQAEDDICVQGCCCYEAGGVKYADTSITENQCPTDDFHSHVTTAEDCRDACDVDEPGPPAPPEEHQCIYYFCDGEMIPQGPPAMTPGDLINVHYAFREIDGQIVSGMTTPVTSDGQMEHYLWFVTDEDELYLYDGDRNLVEEEDLDDFEMDANPTAVADYLEEYGDIDNIDTMASVAERHPGEGGKVFLSDQEDLFELSLDDLDEVGSTDEYYNEPSSFDLMSTYASYKFIDYLLILGYDNRLHFYNPSLDGPFEEFHLVTEDLQPMVGVVDTISERTFEQDYYPCLTLIGSCEIWGDCEHDDQCFDLNDCTNNTCEDGDCVTSDLEDGTTCADGEGRCCSGVCYTEGINYDYNESCRTEPFCEDGFLRYNSTNEGGGCGGECKTCQDGFCLDDHEECDSVDDVDMCCEDGECVPCEGIEKCVEDEINCLNDDTYMQCENISDGWVWSDPMDCDSDLCYESTCESGELGGCSQEPIEEGGQDTDGCYGDEGCDLDGMVSNCRCDAEQECTAFCVDDGDCELDEDDPCSEAVCDVEEGSCEVDEVDGGACTIDGEVGFCDEGECRINAPCDEDNDCEPLTCYEKDCTGGECSYTPMEEGVVDTFEHEGETVIIECDGGGGFDFIRCEGDTDCPERDCHNRICTNEGYCKLEPDSGDVCTLDDGSEGVCYQGECLTCSVDDDCDEGEVCVEGECHDCVKNSHCEDDEICDDYECVFDCREDEDACQEDEYCNEDTGECVGCIYNENCEEGEVCEAGECVDECEDEGDCSGDDVCLDGACVECEEHGNCPSGEVCDLSVNECVDCLDADDCEGDEYCYENICLSECSEDDECPGDEVCDNGECVECIIGGDQCEEDEICAGGQCFGCLKDNNCDEGEICVDDACVEICDSHEDCDEGEYCDEETGECVECNEDNPCESEHEVCHHGECLESCEESEECPYDKVCVDGACVDCQSNEDCPEGELCDTFTNECFECAEHNQCPGCPGGEHFYAGVCIDDCDEDEDCPCEEDVCLDGECVNPCEDADDCDEGRFCEEEQGVCVDCLEPEHCDDGNECTINNCTEDYDCEETNVEAGTDCELDDGSEGVCYEGECEEGCSDSDECRDMYDDREYCGEEDGVCYYCLEEDHCELDEDDTVHHECREVDRCTTEGECEYEMLTGDDCDREPGDAWVCYMGNCVEECEDDEDCEGEGSRNECYEDGGYCVECESDGDCDDGNDCTTNSCEDNECTTEYEDDLNICAGGDGYCCNGECQTDIGGTDFDSDCQGDLTCQGGVVEYGYANQGEVCDDTECTVCNYGYCNYDNSEKCEGEENQCHEGNCVECEDRCDEGETQCTEEGEMLKECEPNPNYDTCYEWGQPEQCPHDICEDPYCSGGECGVDFVQEGERDSGCADGIGCEGELCRCDGQGDCDSIQCDNDEHCEDEQRPCRIGNCVDGECEFENMEDGSNCPGGTCCGGVCNTDTDNEFYNESCRSEEAECVGGSYQYVAENDGEICAGECAVCNNGLCEDNHSLCSDGEECANGQCSGCEDVCEEGETRCHENGVQTCEEINGCMLWGASESCEDDGVCTEAVCEDGECVVENVEEEETTSECYSSQGCGGEECHCDGEGSCVIDEGPLVVNGENGNGENGNGDPDPVNGENGEIGNGEDEGMSILWFVLLIVLTVVVLGGGVGFYFYYTKGGEQTMKSSRGPTTGSRQPSTGSKPTQAQKTTPESKSTQHQQTSTKPAESQRTADKQGSSEQTGKTSETQSKNKGLKKSAALSKDVEKDLLKYLHTLKTKGPDKEKEVELMNKGVTYNKLTEIYENARREKEKKLDRKRKLSKLEK